MIDSKIHSKSLIVKSILGKLERPFWVFQETLNNNSLIVLNYHSTPKKFIPNLAKQLDFYSRHFEIVSPFKMNEIFDPSNSIKSTKPKMLLTFDDGLKNNLYAIELLDKLELKGLFFVVPHFIEAANQKEYYLTHIRDFINSNIDAEKEDFEAMSWDDLSAIIKKGHAIGCHSMTHKMKNTNTLSELEIEIIKSKETITEKLGIEVGAFCAPNNSLFSVNKTAKDLINTHYTFFHSTFPGSNIERQNNFIKRSNVECFWPLGAVKLALGGIERKRWESEITKFKKL